MTRLLGGVVWHARVSYDSVVTFHIIMINAEAGYCKAIVSWECVHIFIPMSRISEGSGLCVKFRRLK